MKKRYQKKNPIEHCIDRPDMYVGSTRLRMYKEFVGEKIEDKYHIFQKNIKSSSAILRIFIEALSNAIDNVERSKKTKTPCTKIKIILNDKTGETSIWNDGDIVPIEINEDEKCYNHTMIFGQLLTGSNYDDEEDRIIAGRNGLGIKLTNIFSTEFIVEGCDPENNKILIQKWTNNMRKVEEPKIKNTKIKKGYTKVTWFPDFKQFNLKNYTKDIIKLYTRHVIDAAMLSKVDVYFNNELIPIKTLAKYADLYETPTNEKLLIKHKTSEVLITPSNEYEIISFVNGIYTKLGGQHVDAWSEKIFRPIVDKFNGKTKKSKTKNIKININDVKQFFRIFVISTIIRPEFDGQDKNKLESPSINATVKQSDINKICKWSIMSKIEDIIRSKEMMILKRTEKKKKNIKVDGLDPANNAGGKYSKDCCLFICEGLSAKTYVVSGINKGVYNKKGRDWFGILPVTGKLLNVRNATTTSIASNKIITSLIQATGLRYDIDYTQNEKFNTLSYGKIIIIADADVDGIHIEGLIINMIHTLFPSILKRQESYVTSMKTPIARIIKGKGKGKDLLFYDEIRFKNFISQQTNKINVKYYKGLGTTKEEDVPDTFGIKMIEYKNDEFTSNNMNKIFNKKYADSRKKWLQNYDPNYSKFSLDDIKNNHSMTISDFLDGEMIKFSFADCSRSIPNGIDGLKESQRKILYAIKKRNLKYSGKSLKVAQLSGYTAEHSNYHHGEQNLQDTIVGMAANFPGSNNVPLLYPDGGFGTRLEGGKDAASARYIFTKLERLTEYIFREEDEPLLTQINDDGDLVQPEHYIPIIPMILINGCTAGIGTGWSCNVPCYNPLDIIKCVKIWIENDGEVLIEDPDTQKIISMFPYIKPWYRGFKGEISSIDDNKFITEGIINNNYKNKTKEIIELPIGLWTNKFKEFCEDLIENKNLKSMKNYSTTKNINFVLTENTNFKCNIQNLKLQTYIYTSNMVLFNENNNLIKYNNTDQIIDNFCKNRLTYYVKRKIYKIKKLEDEIKYLSNKQRFIKDVISKKIIIMNKQEKYIINELFRQNYDKDPQNNKYDYLLRMQLRVFTVEKIKELNNDISSMQNKLKILKSISEEQIWIKELNEFESNYKKWLIELD